MTNFDKNMKSIGPLFQKLGDQKCKKWPKVGIF